MDFSKALIFCLALVHLLCMTGAIEFHVGNNNRASWQIPPSPDAFDKWAQKNRFQIGDSIVFKYDGKTDSVLQVSEADYTTCTKENPIKSYNDGNTIITLDKSGPFYFISGAEGHCQKGQRLDVRVLAANHHLPSTAAPAPKINHNYHIPAPAPAPHNGAAKLPFGFTAFALAVIILLVD